MVVQNKCSRWTTEDLIQGLRPILTNFLLDEESNGEVIVYTGLKETDGGWLVDVAAPD